jgi:elongation factor G
MSRPPVMPIAITIDPAAPESLAALLAALEKFSSEEPPFQLSLDAGRVTITGQDERQLDRLVGRLRRECAAAFSFGALAVAYRETLRTRAEVTYARKKLSVGAFEFAKVKILFAPTKRGDGFSFASTIRHDKMPAEWVAGVEAGVISIAASGNLAGFPVTDVQATLVDAGYHQVDSSRRAFEIAARAAFREALNRSGALLEPIMLVEVQAAFELSGALTGDLMSRRGRIVRQEECGDSVAVRALAPLANMFGYEASLRGLARSARASFTMQFDHYDFVAGHDDDPPPAAAMALRG